VNALKQRPHVHLQRKLNTFDVTSLVVGSIVGADIYIAAAIGARLVGPSSLLVWVLAGTIATVIALSFAHCATVWPKVGGPYAYNRELSGPFAGFTVGWALLIAEWLSLAVFPVAFVQYLTALVPFNNDIIGVLLKGSFIAIVFVTNLIGIKAAGRFNDALTIIKLAPLLLLMIVGLGYMGFNSSLAEGNFQPFVTGSASEFGTALVLIFWAYAGFELSTLPANEIENPRKTVPKAIITGMLIVAAFYLLTNFVIVGTVPQGTLASSQSPLLDSAHQMFSGSQLLSQIMPVVVGVGALISILGADESGTIGTSRLAYALSLDGLMPRRFSDLHGKFGTPKVALLAICLTAFVASALGTLIQLINASVFLLAFVYFATCLASLRVRMRTEHEHRISYLIPIVGILFSVALMALVSLEQILISFALLLVGIPIYAFFSPKKEMSDLKSAFLSRDAVLRRAYYQGERFLAYPWRRLLWAVYGYRNREKPWIVHKNHNERS
jgi:basic amino acid/polyamine antiporter, APA family